MTFIKGKIPWNKGKNMTHSGSFKKGHKGFVSNLNKKVSENIRQKISKSLKGNIPWNKGKKNPYSTETLKKMSRSGKSPWNKGTKGICKTNSGSFKKGHTLIPKRIRIYANNGYILIHSPNHPYRQKTNRVAEHRLIIENIIGRFLSPSESVHHIDEIKDNNIPINLIAFTSESAHQRFHKNPNNVKPEEIVFDGRVME